MTDQKLCHCGKPLHYTNKELEKQVLKICEQFGDYIDTIVKGSPDVYRVQRHYIALHGIKGEDLAKLGFKKVTPDATN